MDEIAERINRFIAAVEDATRCLRTRTSMDISTRDVEAALTDALEIEQSVDLLDREWTSDAVVEVLVDYDFQRLRPEILESVSLDRSIVPDGVTRLLTEERIKHRGEIWDIHKNDADPFPSSPHAHNYESGHKLHLGNGGLYLGRKHVGSIRTKDLGALRDKIRFRPLPELEV